MKIRWNTTYAEILRGIDLKPVRYAATAVLYIVRTSWLTNLCHRLSTSGSTHWTSMSQGRPEQLQDVDRGNGE